MERTIYVDGCSNKTIGACSSVVDFNGNDLIGKHRQFLDKFDFLCWFDLKDHQNRLVYEVSFSDVSSQQNNGAELVASLIGVMIALKYGYDTILSDSQLIVDSWSKKISPTIKDKRKMKIQKALVKLVAIFNERGGKILKISGDDNLADLGFHRKK